MNIYQKAHDLGWQVKQVSGKAPYKYWIEPIGSLRADGPPLDKHFATGKKDVEALLLALEAGESTDRWLTPH